MTRGKKIALKGLYVTWSKGKRYVYAWRRGPRIKAELGTPEFMVEYTKALESRKARPGGDTIAGLILEFRASRSFNELAPASKKDYERSFERILKKFGPAPTAAFRDDRIKKDIRKWHESFAQDRQADKILGAFSRLLNFAVADGYLSVNPAASIPHRYRRNPDPNPVDAANLKKVTQANTTPPEVALAIRFMALTGFARADAASVLWRHVKSDRIEKRRTKSRVRSMPPITPELRECLDLAPRRSGTLTVLINPKGQPWRADGLGKAVSAAFKAQGLNHTSHDLRATYACHLMSMGATDEEAADMMGWSTQTVRQIRKHYVDDESIFAGRIAKFTTKREQNSQTRR